MTSIPETVQVTTRPTRPSPTTLGIFVVLAILGGANVVAVRFNNRELDPLWGAGFRFGLTTPLFIAVALAMRLRFPRGRALVGLILYGVLGFGVSLGLLYLGVVDVPAGLATLISASVPLLTLLFALIHRQETFRWQALVGSVVALVGVGIMAWSPSASAIPALALIAVAASGASFAEATVIARMFPEVHVVTANAVAMGVGSVVLLLWSLAAGESPTLPTETSTWVALAYLVLIGSFGLYALFLYVLDRWTASATSYLFVLIPVSGVSLSAWLDGEPLTAGLLVGGVVIILGTYLGAFWSARRREPG